MTLSHSIHLIFVLMIIRFDRSASLMVLCAGVLQLAQKAPRDLSH